MTYPQIPYKCKVTELQSEENEKYEISTLLIKNRWGPVNNIVYLSIKTSDSKLHSVPT